MKTISSNEIKEMKASMKQINATLKAIHLEDITIENARSNRDYDSAMYRNRERFYELMKQINEMAEQAADIYNHYTTGCTEWMTAEACYMIEKL